MRTPPLIIIILLTVSAVIEMLNCVKELPRPEMKTLSLNLNLEAK